MGDLTTPEAVKAYSAYLNIYKSGYAPESHLMQTTPKWLMILRWD